MKLPNQKGFSLVFIMIGVIAILIIGYLIKIDYQRRVDIKKAEVLKSVYNIKAPIGFSWKNCEKMQARFLVPDGWYFHEGGEGDQTHCYFSKDSFDEKGYFVTGFTINAIRNFTSKEEHQSPTVYAKDFIKAFEKLDGAKIEYMKKTLSEPDLERYSVIYKRDNAEYKDHKVGNITVFQEALGDNKHDVLYLYWFESPTESWEENGEKFGITIMDDFITRLYEIDPDRFASGQALNERPHQAVKDPLYP